MRRIVLLSMIALAAAAPSARAQNAPGGCTKMWDVQSGDVQQVNGANHTILLRDVRINCNDIQLFADQVELISDADRLRATGNVVFVSTGNRISADRLDFNTRTKTGTFYVASGIANLEARGVDRSFFGTQEPDALLLGRDDRKARAAHLQDHARRIHDVRPADAALAARGHVRRTDARKARHPEERPDEGEGRPGVLHSGNVLPDQQAGSRDRLSDPDLRQFDGQRPDDQERVLLGDQPQPGRDVLQRLLFQDRLLRWRSVPLRPGGRVGQRPVQHRAPARGVLRSAGRLRQRRARHRQLYVQRHALAGAPGQPARDGARRLLLEPRRAAALPAEHLRGHESHAELRRQHHRQLGRQYRQQHVGARRNLHERDGLDRQRHARRA